MPVIVRSFAKINLGLAIGASRPDGFHELRTVYQTIALHDRISVTLSRGEGIEIKCNDPRVPTDRTNTCWKVAERVATPLAINRRVTIAIRKNLPVQGGLGGASGNAVATMFALERAAKRNLLPAERLRIAAEVGSDLPLFIIGGTVLGSGRGEEVFPLPDLPPTPCVIVTPEVGVCTPKAFADWDAKADSGSLTGPTPSVKLIKFSRQVSSWLSVSSGVPGKLCGGRAGNPLLDLVQTGIENDFEQVVFSQYPELRELKKVLVRQSAVYVSLSGSGSALYGLFRSSVSAKAAALRLRKSGIAAVATATMPRAQMWRKFLSKN